MIAWDPSHRVAGEPRAWGGWLLLESAGVLVLAAVLVGPLGVLDALAVVLQVTFLAYFVRYAAFTASALASGPGEGGAELALAPWGPPVSVLVACRNEESVIERLVGALLAVEYPKANLQLVIVDDGSTDRTSDLLAALAAAHPEITPLQRPAGSGGGKAGALNFGLSAATGEVVVVFDADHVPRSDVVARLARHFADPAVGAVQGRCEIANAEDSMLTRLVSIDYLAGYLVDEYGRQSVYSLPAYGGANCAIRASALRALGGWNPASVTEDTDVTLRLCLAGWRVRYDVGALDAEEGVVSIGRFWRQRYRWARGHQQAWRDYRRAVWRNPRMSVAEKVETTMFLFGFHLPACSALGLGLSVAWLAGLAPPLPLGDLFVFWTLLFVGPLLELGGALLISGAARNSVWLLPLFLPLFFVSIALCTKAWLDAALGRGYSWVKTSRAADLVETDAPALGGVV